MQTENTEINSTELIDTLQNEIITLQNTIDELTKELEQHNTKKPLTLKEIYHLFLSPRALIMSMGEHLRENLLAYLLSGLLASIIASGIETMMRVHTLEDIKTITEEAKLAAMTQVKDSVESSTDELNERLSQIEQANEKLLLQVQRLTNNEAVSKETEYLKQTVTQTQQSLNVTKEQVSQELQNDITIEKEKLKRINPSETGK